MVQGSAYETVSAHHDTTSAYEPAGIEHLDRLGQALTRRGYLVMLTTDSSHPRLDVVNRVRPVRHGSVLCEPDRRGGWWFWWSWADRIAPADDLEQAVDQVDCLLCVMADAA